DLDLVVAGIESGITMVEAAANEVSEDVITEALGWAHQAFQPAIALQRELVEKVQPEPQEYELVLPSADIQAVVDDWVEGKLGSTLRKPYPERNAVVNEVRWQFHEEMMQMFGEDVYTTDMRDQYDEAFTMALH